MNAMKWTGWGCVGWLAAGCILMTGCGGGDGDSTDSGGGGTTIVVTNAPNPAPVQMVAPQLIAPEDGKVISTILPSVPRNVEFEWTVVPGAASYILEVDGTKYTAASTKLTQALHIGAHKWRVWGLDADGGNGPPSGKFTVTIKLQVVQI